MLFAIMSQDVENSLDKRLSARPRHLERLEILLKEERLVLAGPFPHPQGEGFTGSLIVADFDSLDAAQTWADADPYVEAGVYAAVAVKPFKKVFP